MEDECDYVFWIFSLSHDTREYFTDFGSDAVLKLGFRDSWVMIGQRGLGKGKAIEQVRMTELYILRQALFSSCFLSCLFNTLTARHKILQMPNYACNTMNRGTYAACHGHWPPCQDLKWEDA